MKIIYYVDGNKFAMRRSDFVPRTGDEIRFNGVIYGIEKIVWIEDEDPAHVAIEISVIE